MSLARSIVASPVARPIAHPAARPIARPVAASLAVSIAAAAASVCLPSLALADPHPMSSGASPAPTTDTQIAMSKETLSISMELTYAQVNAAVTLDNHGPAARLQVGFPCSVGELAGAIDVPCKTPLTVTQNGKKVTAKKKKTSKTQWHWVWPLALGEGAKAELVVSYRAPLLNDRYSLPADGMGAFTYRLTTGARWAGPISSLDITLDLHHDALLYVSPPGYTREPGRITWHLTDHEPVKEVVVFPHPTAGGRLLHSLFSPERRGKLPPGAARARLAAGDYARADVEATIAQLRDPRGWGPEWLEIISRVTGVPAPSEAESRACVAESIAVLEKLAANAKR